MGKLELLYFMVIAGLLVGASLYLDRKGVPVTGRVIGRQERVIVGHEPSGQWRRYYEVAAAFDLPGGGSSQATVRVAPERYDSLHMGDRIALRYLPQFPLLARTTDRSTAGIVSEMAWNLAGIPLLVWLAGGIVGFAVTVPLGIIPVLAAGGAWLAAGYVMLLTPPSPKRPGPLQAPALVRAITLIDKSPARMRARRGTTFDRRLAIPYQVVELLVPTRGGRDTVLAVDAVDSGSVAGLGNGAILPVRLDPAAPRAAQLAGGTRRFVEANRYHFRVPVIGLAVLGTLAGVSYRWRRRKAQPTNSTEG